MRKPWQAGGQAPVQGLAHETHKWFHPGIIFRRRNMIPEVGVGMRCPDGNQRFSLPGP